MDKLVNAHEFPVPDFYVETQIRSSLEQRVAEMAMQGVDITKLKIDWGKAKAANRDDAIRQVRATLILGKIAERESIETMTDELDREVHRIAKARREPAAATRKTLQEDGSLQRLASRIKTDKVLNFLFENARKVAAG